MNTGPVQYILKQGTETLYNGRSQSEAHNIAKRMGYALRPGKRPCSDCLVETVVTMHGQTQYFYFPLPETGPKPNEKQP